MKIKNKLVTMYNTDKVYLAEWILAVVTGLFVFVTTSTWDSQSLTIWSTNVWDVIADGNFRGFYEYTASNVNGVHHSHMGSEIMSVLPWSIWNLPLWIMQRFFGKPIMSSAIMLAYSKMFLVLCTVIMLVYAKKITYLITGDKSKSVWAMFLTASSTYIYLSVCYSGQNDILMITASVIGVHCLLKNKHKAFIAWSLLAVSIKPFFLLPFLAVLLLTEKNFLKIFGKAFIVSSGVILQKMIFRGAPGYKESMNIGPAKKMLEQMFPPNINTEFGSISFFAISLVLIYLYSYTRDFKKEDYADSQSLIGKYVIYIITLTYAGYLMFSPFSFYRMAILLPFLYIVLVQNKNMVLYNGIFDIAAQFGLMMKLILRGSRLFEVRFVNKALIQRFFGYNVEYKASCPYSSVDLYLYDNKDLLEHYQPLFSGVAVVSVAMLLILNHPEKQLKFKINGDRNIRALLWVRTLIIVPFVLLTLYLFAKSPYRF